MSEVKQGRPSIYTKELADEICNRLSLGESLRRICLDENMPEARTIHYWLLDATKPEFFQQYTHARNIQAELLFEELLDLADKSVEDIEGNDKSDGARVQARKLQVDSRKWYISKVLPKKFGDKMDVTSGNKPIPLLNGLRNNNSNEENSEAQETN